MSKPNLTPDQKLKLLERALDTPHPQPYTAADVIELCRAGEFRWWDAPNGVAITQIIDAPTGRAVEIKYAFGRLEDVMSLQPAIEADAIAKGCRVWVGDGRLGWAKVLKKHGWKITGVTFCKELIPERTDGEEGQ